MNKVLEGAVLHLSREEALKIVESFERDGGKGVTSDQVQLLERFFLENPNETELGNRYEEALRRHMVAK